MGSIWERQIRFARAILSSLLSTHRKSLDEESLLALVAETEGFLNSQPLTVEAISDPTSDLPLAPSNILTMKSKVVMPPPWDFSRPDLYCWKRWCCVQHIANEFWSCWRKEYFQSLQSWSDQWPMARVIQVFKDNNGYARSVKLRIRKIRNSEGNRILERPVSNIVLRLEQECVQFPDKEKQKKWTCAR